MQSFVAKVARQKITKGGSVSPSAQTQIAGQRTWSRWVQGRLSLVLPIGVIVAVAIVCVVVAVLTSAQRADEVSLKREQLVVQRMIAGKGVYMTRQIESVAATRRAALMIRNNYDPQWVERAVGRWLQTYHDHDAVVVVDGADQIKYATFRAPGDAAAADLRAELATSLDFMR